MELDHISLSDFISNFDLDNKKSGAEKPRLII